MKIYLDNAATSFPKPDCVYRAVDNYLRQIGVSPGRGTYKLAMQADEIVYNTRKLLAELFNINDCSRIIFNANITAALNLALKGYLRTGDHVITTGIEHNAMWRPLQRLVKERDINISSTRHQKEGLLDLEHFRKLFRKNTRLVAVNHASNVLGTIMPLREIGLICKEYGVALLVDTAQTAGVVPIDVQANGIDLLAFTGHKGLLGPPGTGGLYVAANIELATLIEGGTGSFSLLTEQPKDPPDRYEAGTLNAPGISGLQAGVEYILSKGITEIHNHEMSVTSNLLAGLKKMPGLEIYGPSDLGERVAVVSFNILAAPPEEVAYVLDRVYGIMVRAGLHCSPQSHRLMGTIKRGTVRISAGPFTTHAEISTLLKAIRNIAGA